MKKMLLVVLLLLFGGVVATSVGCQKKVDPKMKVKFDK